MVRIFGARWETLNWDKSHRCPVWSGPKFNGPLDPDGCDSGSIRVGGDPEMYPYMQPWRAGTCTVCGCRTFPYVTNWLHPGYVTWHLLGRFAWYRRLSARTEGKVAPASALALLTAVFVLAVGQMAQPSLAVTLAPAVVAGTALAVVAMLTAGRARRNRYAAQALDARRLLFTAVSAAICTVPFQVLIPTLASYGRNVGGGVLTTVIVSALVTFQFALWLYITRLARRTPAPAGRHR